MPKLMTHLVANYPNPEVFEQAVEAMLEQNVDYLEIQPPFSHPVADGPTIHQANQAALQFENNLANIVQKVAQIQSRVNNNSTKILLMSYLTPILHFGFEETTQLLRQHYFFGLIVPDLTFFSPEHTQMLELCQQNELQLLPVISPITTKLRIQKIKPFLRPKQVVYATSRVGQTGKQTSLEDSEIQERLDFLKENLEEFELGIGFGIREKSQVEFLNKQGFIAIIGSEIVKRITKAHEQGLDVKTELREFLSSL
jgi:tryptophan synthase alpha chain